MLDRDVRMMVCHDESCGSASWVVLEGGWWQEEPRLRATRIAVACAKCGSGRELGIWMEGIDLERYQRRAEDEVRKRVYGELHPKETPSEGSDGSDSTVIPDPFPMSLCICRHLMGDHYHESLNKSRGCIYTGCDCPAYQEVFVVAEGVKDHRASG